MKTNTTTNYTPEVIHVSAREGQLSTFWKSKSGKYYLTKKEATEDLGGTNVNPNDYAIQVSFFVKYRKYILGALVAAIVAAAIFYFAPKIAAKMKK